jgi:hypothetical protein
VLTAPPAVYAGWIRWKRDALIGKPVPTPDHCPGQAFPGHSLGLLIEHLGGQISKLSAQEFAYVGTSPDGTADKPKQGNCPKNRRQGSNGNNHERPKRPLKGGFSTNHSGQAVQRLSYRHDACIDCHTMNLVLQFLWHWAHLYTSTVKAQQDSCQKQKLHSGIRPLSILTPPAREPSAPNNQ